MLEKLLPLITVIFALIGCDSNETQTIPDTTPPTQTGEMPTTAPTKPSTDKIIYLDQGLDDDTRLEFYFLSQGSQLLPYTWFIALENTNNQQLFTSDQHMRSLGFIPHTKDPQRNPDGLPIGFVKDDNPKTVSYQIKKEFLGPSYDENNYPNTNSWLGFTCASCHTADLRYQGKTIRIEGGSSQQDHQAFMAQLVASLKATLADENKLTRFSHRVLDPNWNQGEQDALKNRVAAYTEVLDRLKIQNDTEVKYGFGRLDAFGSIFNRVLATGLEIPENEFPSDAPVSYPFLWNTPDMDWVQYNSIGGNPIARNVGEVLGVYAHMQLHGTPAEGQFDSTANIENLARLEGYIKSLKSPPWPEDILGELNQDLVKQGKVLYVQNCANCHFTRGSSGGFPMTTENKGGVQFIKTNSDMSLAELGTDPKMIQNVLAHKVDPGILRPLLPEPLRSQEKVPRVIVLPIAVRAVINRELQNIGLPDNAMSKFPCKDRKDWQGDVLKEFPCELMGWRTDPFLNPPQTIIETYRARPLNGIWATGPYLHNGSVPNLYELLLPADQRSKTFHVGSSEFDPKNVGFITSDGFLFETLLPGNSNGGHSGENFTQTLSDSGEYRDFTETERYALIEYMKTLN